MEIDSLILTNDQMVKTYADAGLVIAEPRPDVLEVWGQVNKVITGDAATASVEKMQRHAEMGASDTVASLFVDTALLAQVVKQFRYDEVNETAGSSCARISIRRLPLEDTYFLDIEWCKDSPRAIDEPIRHAYLMPLSGAGGRLAVHYPPTKPEESE